MIARKKNPNGYDADSFDWQSASLGFFFQAML